MNSENGYVPFIVPLVFRYNAKEKLPIGIIAEVSEDSSSLISFLNILNELNATIEYFAYYKVDHGRFVIVIADLHKTDKGVTYLVKRLKKAQIAKDLNVAYPRVDGMLILKNVIPTSFNNERFVIKSSRHFYSIIEGLGEESRRALLWHIWYKGGRHMYKVHREVRKREGIETLRDTLLACEASGWWVNSKLVKYDNYSKIVKIRLWDNWECSEIKKKMGVSKKPASQLIRGFLSGILSEHFNLEMVAEETKCIVKNDPCCEFVLKPAGKHWGNI